MWKQHKTVEARLYHWLKRKTTPVDAWKQMSIKALAKKVQCSTSQVSRSLPKAIARLEGLSIDDAEKLVSDLMRVRQGGLVDFEIEMIRQIRQIDKPPSIWCIANIFCVSAKQVRTVCKRFGVDGARGYTYWSHDLADLIPEGINRQQFDENIKIRKQLREKHRKIGNDLRFQKLFGSVYDQLRHKYL